LGCGGQEIDSFWVPRLAYLLAQVDEPVHDDAAHRALLPLSLCTEPLDKVRANGNREPGSVLRQLIHAMSLAVAPPTSVHVCNGAAAK